MAILLVLVHHFAGAHEKSGWVAQKMMGFAEAGWSGVDLFFCLSGFLITGILLESKKWKHPLRTFYMRRTLRIFPLYYITLAVLFLAIPAIVDVSPAYQEFTNHQWWHWAYIPNILIVFKIPNATLATSHFWSLAIEEQFYMVWPFVVLFTPIEVLKRVCYGLFLSAFAFRVTCFAMDWGHSPAYVLPIARLDALVAGSFVAIALRDIESWSTYRKAARIILPIALCTFVSVFLFQGSFRRGPLMMTLGFSSLALIFSIMVGAAALNAWPKFNKVLEHPFLRFFGKYSYAMYVFHTFIIGWMLSWFPSPTDTSALLSSGPARIIVFTVVGIALTSVAGVLSWVLVESHILKLKRFFEPQRAHSTSRLGLSDHEAKNPSSSTIPRTQPASKG